jgi:hypothetical protein
MYQTGFRATLLKLSAHPNVQNTLDRFWQGFFTSLARQPFANFEPKPRLMSLSVEGL